MDSPHVLELLGESLMLRLRAPEPGLWLLDWLGPADAAPPPGEGGFRRLPASPDTPVGPSLMPCHGAGFHGIGQIDAYRVSDRRRIAPVEVSASRGGDALEIRARDPQLQFHIIQRLSFAGDVLSAAIRLENAGEDAVDIQRAAALLLPAPDWADEALTHAGAWGREGRPERRDWRTGRIEQTGRGGRPGFDGGPTLTLCEAATQERSGRALTVHLAWSGSFRLAAERATEGSGQVCAEPHFAPGEIRLEPGETLDLPEAVLTVSDAGFAGLSHSFHAHARGLSRPVTRKVHFNTWEARYFDVSEAACRELADAAAALGAERFILDDGWFRGRRDDTTSLGDWFVDDGLYPDGLGPLIEHVRGLGIGFGLWVEPEMVSPDSDLFRAHPDWALGHPQDDLPTGRNQLVLDLALPEVEDWLFTRLSALLDAHEIEYLKWDCNRDLYPARRDGVERGAAQAEALYHLLGRLNAAYPALEIESCASGGGRIDMGVLPHVTRFWTSDATDAIDRIRIQRAAGLVMPPEVLGAHVGPSPNPMTGRRLPMAFRALASFFGHFGVEEDPARLDGADRAVLTRAIARYKSERGWMSTARQWRLGEPGDDPDAEMLVGADGARAALRVLRVGTPARPLQPRIRLAGLEAEAVYEVEELALQGEPPLWPLGRHTGAALMEAGLDVDPGRAETGRLIFLERVEG